MDRIKYQGQMTPIPGYAEAVLLDIINIANVDSVLITSTTRTPVDQARIMFQNIRAHGAEKQKELYGVYGQQVIAVYEALQSVGATDLRIKSAMFFKIVELGSQNVSKHCADPATRSVFDVAPSSVPDNRKEAFEVAVNFCFKVDRFFKPPVDPAYHIEIVKG